MSERKDFSEYKLTVRESDKPSGKLVGPKQRLLSPGKTKPVADVGIGNQTRAVICFRCSQISIVTNGAFSTQCKHCGAHMNLEDFTLSPYSKKKLVETHGDVYIHPGARLTGMTIRCQNLIMDGSADGQFYCFGNLIINQSCTIRGLVQAGRLKVSRKARVAFLENVYLKAAEIDGEVTGNLFCDGIVSLGDSAVLVGDVTAHSLLMPLGSVYKGNYRIAQN